MTDLKEFGEKIKQAGGVKNISINKGRLYVTYLANPSNYATKRDDIRREYPEITHIDTETDSSGHKTLVYE